MSVADAIREVVFVDGGVAARSAGLVQSLQAEGRQVVVLDAGDDGLAQMVSSLSGLSGLQGIHLVSHGDAGRVWLGGRAVGTQDLAAQAAQWSALGQSLAQGGDLLLYGCDIADGGDGLNFINELARLTGAHVAASDDATGPQALGGDALLEASTGPIEAEALDLYALDALLAAPSIGSLDSSITFTEGGDPMTVDNNMTITGGGSYIEGFIRFAVSSSNTGDQFTLTSNANPNDAGAISVVGSDVFLGNGTGRDRIGSVDAVENGRNGQALKVLFSSPLPNAGFEEGEANWTVKDEQYGDSAGEINFDNYSITLANNSDSDSSYTGGTGTVNIQPPNGTVFNGSVANGQGVGGSKALYLSSSGSINRTDQDPSGSFQQDGYGSIHGPYATSAVIKVEAGDSISLAFKAVGSGDDYEVFGLLRRVDGSGNFLSNAINADNIVLFAERGADTGGYRTITKTGLPAGEYRFEFVGGTYDGSGGLVVGSNLYVDNIRLISSKTVNDAVVTAIARQVAYQNTGTDSPPSRTITVSTSNQNGETGSATTTLQMDQANNAPSFTGPATLAAINEDSTPTGATVASLFNSLFSDPDTTYAPADTLAGVAISANNANATTQGEWQYSTDAGSTWHDVGTVSTAAALVLPHTALIRFLPVADYNGTPGGLTAFAVDSTYGDTFTSGATRVTFNTTTDDGESAVSAAGVALGTSVTAVNDAPRFTSTAAELSYADTSAPDTFVTATGTITANDVDGDTVTFGIDGGTVSGGIVTKTSDYGTLTINRTSGSYSFAPNAAAINALTPGTETVTFTITASDGTLSSNQSLTIELSGVNDLPVGVDDLGTATEKGGSNNAVAGSAASGNVLTNDSDADTGSSFTVSGAETDDDSAVAGEALTGLYGTLVLQANGSYVYTIDEDNEDVEALQTSETLDDVFTYTVLDNAGASSTATLTIRISGANDAPRFSSGTVSLGALSDTAAPDTFDPVSGTLAVSDVDGDTMTFGITGGTVADGVSELSTPYGTLVLNIATGAYVFTPDETAVNALPAGSETVTFTITASDGVLTSSQDLTIDISGVNDLPVLGDDIGNAVEAGRKGNDQTGAPATGNVLLNDTDPDTGATFAVVSAESHGRTANAGTTLAGQYGTLVLQADGSYVYTIDENNPDVEALAPSQVLEDSFTYTVLDNAGGSATATLTIRVGGASEAPIAHPDYVVAVEDFLDPRGNVLANDTDQDVTDRLTVVDAGTFAGQYGTLILGANGDYQYIVDNTAPAVQALTSRSTTLTETFSYTVRDIWGFTSTSTLSVEIQGHNDAPVGGGPLGSRGAVVGQRLDLTLPTETVFDPDGPTSGLRYSVRLSNGEPAPAWLNIDPHTGRLYGTPGNGDEGELNLSIVVTDAHGASTALNWVTLNVHNPNDAPVFTTPSTVAVPDSGTRVTTIQATDADGDTVTYRISGGDDAARFRIDARTGELHFTSQPDFDNPRDADRDNRYEVIIEAGDGRGGVIRRLHTIELQDDDGMGGDRDGDGIDDREESSVPGVLPDTGTGDGNGDGIPDIEQPGVASRQLTDTQGRPAGHATLVAGDDGTVTGFEVRGPVGALPDGVPPTSEAWGFKASLPETGGTRTFEVFLPGDQSFTGLWAKDAQGNWVEVPVTAERVGDRWKISFEVTDGGVLDADGRANGAIDSVTLLSSGRDGLAVHRFQNDGDGLQFLTATVTERDGLVSSGEAIGWDYEGIAFVAPTSGEIVPVWRFFHEASGDHFYTATPGERDALLQGDFGYAFEGPSFSVFPVEEEGSLPVHRYFSLASADHVYTTDPADHAELIGSGYAYEGVLGYVFA